MSGLPALWMRQESRPDERRAPLSPDDAGRLVTRGVSVSVEECPRRVFRSDSYAAAGARIVPAGSWIEDADSDQVILGLKELPADPAALRHRHVYFGHAYKGQQGAGALLDRFAAGGGRLLDLEYLTGDNGVRLAAFGYWAGYVGAALAVLLAAGRLRAPLTPWRRPDLDRELAAAQPEALRLNALVIGAHGRCGRGATDSLAVAGAGTTLWDLEETRQIDRPAVRRHDLLVNCVLASTPVPPFVRPEDVADGSRRLSTIADVTCDVGAPTNVLPIYDRVTTWSQPLLRLHPQPPLDLIAIDNLPSLLPLESSLAFSADLWPHLLQLPPDRLGAETGPWAATRRRFDDHFGETIGAGAPDPIPGAEHD